MRIAVDGRLLSGPQTGSARYLRGLLGGMSEAGRQLQVMVLGRERLEETPAGIGWVECPEAHLLHVPWEQLQLPAVLEQLRAEVFISPSMTLPLVRVCPQIVVIYDLGFERHPEFFAPALGRYLRRWVPPAARLAEAVVTLSEFGRQEVVGLYEVPAERVDVIPAAAGAGFHPRGEAEGLGEVCRRYALRRPFVLYVGAMERNKNLPRLVAAFAAVQTGEWQLVRAGPPGSASGEVAAAICRHQVPAQVRVLGRVAEADLPGLYSAAEVFAFPSLYEGFGLPALEAMACGTAVLASRRGPLPEVLGEAAAWVEAEEVESIAAGLQTLMQAEPRRSQLAQAGLVQAGRFSWRASSESLLELSARVTGAESERDR